MRYKAVWLLLLCGSLVSWGQSADTVAPRLLRTVQIGTLQDITVGEIRKIASTNNGDYVEYNLARAALLVLHQDLPGATPFDELLDSALNTMVQDGNANVQPSSLAPGFGRKELVFTLIYAMAMSGEQDRAVDDLEKHLSTGSRYKHAVVMQSLRNIGTQRAVGLIQQFVEKGDDRNLGENTLIDEDAPVLVELHARWSMVPPAQRTRDQLTTIVKSGCSERTAMAAYWLGFYPPNPDPAKEQAELEALRVAAENSTPGCDAVDHIVALKALGLRSSETMEYWARIARHYDDKSVWERYQALLNAWGRFGLKFAPIALDLLKTEPSQYVQWELLHGNFLTRKHVAFRSTWDIWIPSTLQLYLNYPDPAWSTLPEADVDRLLAWLESGSRPQAPWVQNHMLYGLAFYVTDDSTMRFLRLFNTWPQRDKNWWIIANLRDPKALPLLRYWSSLPTEDRQARAIQGLVAQLETQAGVHKKTSKCCSLTKACLLTRVGADPAEVVIHSETEATHWLAGAALPVAEDVRIVFTDELQRIADVDFKDGERQHWEYIYDCWRRVGDQVH